MRERKKVRYRRERLEKIYGKRERREGETQREREE